MKGHYHSVMGCFASSRGVYVVEQNGSTALIRDREDLWFYSVGKLLRESWASADSVFESYCTAGVGSLAQKSVMIKLHSLKRLHGRVEVRVCLEPQVTDGVTRVFSATTEARRV